MSGNLRLVDAHHHLWDPNDGSYPWMTGPYAPLSRRFDREELEPILARNGVTATILVQARADIHETVKFLEEAHRSPYIAGVVGWIDLTTASVGDQIDYLRSLPSGNLLVGVRHAVADEHDSEWLLQTEVSAGLDVIAEKGLTFDLEVTTRELNAAVQSVREHPTLNFVLDHLGKPPIEKGWNSAWAAGLELIAEQPNTWAKISGLVTEAAWTTWSTADLTPVVDCSLQLFGASRLMFGSDWPVCTLAATYDQVLASAREALATLSSSERDLIFAGSAEAFYGLAPTVP
ncbi:amidohydrolase family protein [Arthrobacter sp. 2MCAF14]|uniref:amidohydrolase family protein n=1 Tax=Arthrobacter sp. 2MCAF14 TaxID=3232982 RepID=UPI003F91CF10